MASEISHEGVVKKIGEEAIIVEIVSSSACSSCHARGACGASDSVTKEITVSRKSTLGQTYSPGERVEVVMAKSMGNKAVLLCYVIPLFILMAVSIPLSMSALGELGGACAGLCAMALWYFALYLARDRVSGKYEFRLRKI